VNKRHTRPKQRPQRKQDELSAQTESDLRSTTAPLLSSDVLPPGAGINSSLTRQTLQLQNARGNAHVQLRIQGSTRGEESTQAPQSPNDLSKAEISQSRASGAVARGDPEAGQIAIMRTERWEELYTQSEIGTRKGDDYTDIVIRKVLSQANLSGLDLESLVLLEERLRTKIKSVKVQLGVWEKEPDKVTDLGQWRSMQEWLRYANTHADYVAQEMMKRRTGIEKMESFWPTIDEVQKLVSGRRKHLLYNMLPFVWKLVESNGNYEMDSSEQIRCGYLTESNISSLVAPGHHFFDESWMASKMRNNAARDLYGAFAVDPGAKVGASTAANVASELKSIEARVGTGQIYLHLQMGAKEGGATNNADALGIALDHWAETYPESVYSLWAPDKDKAPSSFSLFGSTPFKFESLSEHEEFAKAVDEIHEAEPAVKPVEMPRLVEAKYKSYWYDARILAKSGDQFLVHYVGWDTSWDEKVDSSRIREKGDPQQDVKLGDVVNVEYKNRVYQASIIQVGIANRAGQYRVHWLGYGDNANSWVNRSSVKSFAGSTAKWADLG
jgi:hypothetical protein